MASAEDDNRSTAVAESSPGPPPSLHGSSQRSVHALLGGGAVADVLLWRNQNSTLLAAAGATAAWFLLERGGYSLLWVINNAFLLLVIILFLWAKSASLFNRPLPPLPKLEVSDEVVQKSAAKARVWINRILAIGHDLAIRGDRRAYLEVTVILWIVSYIGSLLNFLTFIYIGFLLCLVILPLYDKYQDHIDDAHSSVLRQYDLLSGTTQTTKEKAN